MPGISDIAYFIRISGGYPEIIMPTAFSTLFACFTLTYPMYAAVCTTVLSGAAPFFSSITIYLEFL